MDGGRHAKDIEVDIADVIVVSLAYLNWLEKDAAGAFKKALEKHEKAIKKLAEKGRK
jgi:NTP pyrophosphatase (non-canonical NTP hydrolase)